MASAADQARALAQSAAPSRQSIAQPFNQGIGDTNRFTDAALANLYAQIGNTSAGYASAVGAQNAQTQAAMARLASLGGQYGAGSAAAAGSMGDAASSELLGQGAAANAYANAIPGALSARGQLLQAGLIKGKQQALQGRQQAITLAIPQYLQEVENQRLAEQQFGLQKSQDAIANANAAAQLAETKREFNVTNAYRYAALGDTATGSGGSAGGLASSLGWTSNELETHVGAATKLLQGAEPEQARVPVYGKPDANGTRHIVGYNLETVGGSGKLSAVEAGVLFPDAVKALIQQGINPQVAIFAAARVYKGSHLVGAGPAMDRSYYSFAQWMAAHGSTKYRRVWRRLNQQNPGSTIPAPGH